jgi:hypothetical protein
MIAATHVGFSSAIESRQQKSYEIWQLVAIACNYRQSSMSINFLLLGGAVFVKFNPCNKSVLMISLLVKILSQSKERR